MLSNCFDAPDAYVFNQVRSIRSVVQTLQLSFLGAEESGLPHSVTHGYLTVYLPLNKLTSPKAAWPLGQTHGQCLRSLMMEVL